MFIGPTSQAPRIDEARMDQVYEVEIGMKEIERQMAIWGQCPPWVIDRTLRNLLIDATGTPTAASSASTSCTRPTGHRTLGLLELRAFEMPPHSKMSLVQQLLLRALVAWFWKEPYQGHGATRLTRWGTGLHDRFMLPSFVLQDFADVLPNCRRAALTSALSGSHRTSSSASRMSARCRRPVCA